MKEFLSKSTLKVVEKYEDAKSIETINGIDICAIDKDDLEFLLGYTIASIKIEMELKEKLERYEKALKHIVTRKMSTYLSTSHMNQDFIKTAVEALKQVKTSKKEEKTNDDWECEACGHEWREENPFISYADCPKCGSDCIGHY